MNKRNCLHCEKEFEISKYQPKQKYCKEKECQGKRKAKWFQKDSKKNISKYKNRRILAKNFMFEYNKIYYKKNKSEILIKNKSYYQKNKKNYSNYNKLWILNNPEKNRAIYLLNKDKKKNLQLYPNECIICETNKNVEFHHPDYNFEFSVYPLCRKHHIAIHNNEVRI